MGGAHGKTKSRKPVPEESCCVCFEVGKKGLHCASGHLLCSECISPYAETIFRDVGVLRDCGFCVPCPAREEASVRCSAPAYDSHALRRFLGEAALDLYLDGLLSVCRQREGGREERTDATARQQLLESLNLKCPNPRCAAILDPSPDGCAAVRCAGCGTYICFLCFQSCSSSSAAHKHVAACEHSPKPGGLFIRDYEVPHKRVRIIALRKVLADLGEAGLTAPQQLKALKSSKAANFIASIKRELKDVHIREAEVLEFDTEPNKWQRARNRLGGYRVGRVGGGGGVVGRVGVGVGVGVGVVRGGVEGGGCVGVGGGDVRFASLERLTYCTIAAVLLLWGVLLTAALFSAYFTTICWIVGMICRGAGYTFWALLFLSLPWWKRQIAYPFVALVVGYNLLLVHIKSY